MLFLASQSKQKKSKKLTNIRTNRFLKNLPSSPVQSQIMADSMPKQF